jgi:hypothetical protein
LRTRRSSIFLLLPLVFSSRGTCIWCSCRLECRNPGHLLKRPAWLPIHRRSKVRRSLQKLLGLLVRRLEHRLLRIRDVRWRSRLPRRRLKRTRCGRPKRLRERRPPSHLLTSHRGWEGSQRQRRRPGRTAPGRRRRRTTRSRGSPSGRRPLPGHRGHRPDDSSKRPARRP